MKKLYQLNRRDDRLAKLVRAPVKNEIPGFVARLATMTAALGAFDFDRLVIGADVLAFFRRAISAKFPLPD